MIRETSADADDHRSFLVELQKAIDSDLATLETVMERLDISPSRSKDILLRLGERFGRGKLNGSVTSRSPLSRLLELEALEAGIRSKQRLWSSLEAMAPSVPNLQSFDFQGLWTKADRQVREVGEWHVDVARGIVERPDSAAAAASAQV